MIRCSASTSIGWGVKSSYMTESCMLNLLRLIFMWSSANTARHALPGCDRAIDRSVPKVWQVAHRTVNVRGGEQHDCGGSITQPRPAEGRLTCLSLSPLPQSLRPRSATAVATWREQAHHHKIPRGRSSNSVRPQLGLVVLQ